jgi:hypothetical protein
MPRGFKHTPEARAKMSAALRGRPWSEARRAKGNGRLGLKHSPETVERMRVVQTGNVNARTAPIKGECVYCFAPAQTFDHVVPRGRPGWNSPDNVVPACYSCNGDKQDRTPEEWFAGKPTGMRKGSWRPQHVAGLLAD